MARKKFRLGERFVFTGGGVDSGRAGVVVPIQMIPIGDRGVYRRFQGHKPIGKDDIAVKYDDGSFDVVNKYWISKEEDARRKMHRFLPFRLPRARNPRNPYGYIIAGRTRPHAWSATRDFPYKDRTEAKRVLGERVRAMGRRGDDVAFDAFLTEPRGRKIRKTRIRVSPYARNPRRQKFGSGSVFPLRSFGVWMSGGKTRTVKAHTANEAAAKAAGGPVIGTGGDPMGPMYFTSKGGRGDSIKVWPKSEFGNPDVRLDWTQRGHSMRDPTGQSEHGTSAWWRTGLKGHEVRKAVKKAHKYASKQKDWTKHRVSVHRNPRKVSRRRRKAVRHRRAYRARNAKGQFVKRKRSGRR